MFGKRTESENQVVFINSEEAKAIFEEQVQGTLGIDGVEFLKRLDLGVYSCEPEDTQITRLIMLTPFAQTEHVNGRPY